MPYRLSEAAAACSLTKSTVRRAIKTGKVSATKDAHGQWHIEPAELHRVYPPRTEASTDERIRAYLAEIALLRDRIEDLKTLTDEFRVWVRDLTEQREPRSAPPSWTSGYWPINRPCRPCPPRAHDGGASRAHPPEHRLISRRRFSGLAGIGPSARILGTRSAQHVELADQIAEYNGTVTRHSCHRSATHCGEKTMRDSNRLVAHSQPLSRCADPG